MSDCSLEIKSLKAGKHFGDWTCSITNYGQKEVSATIKVAKSEPARVEFDTYFGDVTIDIGRQTELPLTCKAINEKDPKSKFKSPPGSMYFELDSSPLTDGVSEWQQVIF